MSRKPTPTALRVVQGNTQRRPLPKNEAKVENVCPKAPRELTARAKRHWPKAARRLSDAKLLGETDIDALIAYCEAFGRWRESCDQIERDGMLLIPATSITTKPDGTKIVKQGTPIRHPAIAIMNKSFEQMTKLMVEFGMTPSSRTKAATIGKSGDDDSEGWGNA